MTSRTAAILESHPSPAPVPVWERARRCSSEKLAGGVCTGLARHWDIDPLLVRALTVLLALSMGVGVVLYAAAWLLMPAPDGPSIASQRFPRVTRMKPWQVGGILVVAWSLALPVLTHVTPFGLGPVVVLAVAYVLVRRSRRVQAAIPAVPSPAPAEPFAASGQAVDYTVPEQFDPYRPAAEPVRVRACAPQARSRKSWPLTAVMVALSGLAAMIGYLLPVPHPLVLSLSLALGVVALLQLVGIWARRPHLGVLFGILLAIGLAGAVAVPRLGVPAQITSGSSASMVWGEAEDLPGRGITLAGTDATVDASGLTLSRNETTTLAVVGSDATIILPRSTNVTVVADLTGGSLTRPDRTTLSDSGTTRWARTDSPGAATWTLHIKVVGSNVKVVAP